MNGIARLRTIGIAAQPTFGVPAPSASFVVPLTNAPQFQATVNKILNNAALGSSYQVNDVEKTTRFTTIPLEFKIDEDQFPLILKQRFTITTTTGSEATVFVHTLEYQNNTNTWYTLFLQDDNLEDYIVQNALFDNLDFTFDQDFVRVVSSAVGAYPTQSAVTNAITQPKEFVGRMVKYLDDNVPGTVTATAVLSLTANLDFGLNSEDTRFGLGSADLAVLRLTSDKFMFNVSKHKDDVSRYDDNENLTLKQLRILVENTDRFIAGATGTRPVIQFDVPRAKIENYTEEVDLEELVRENFDLTALKPAGVADTPMKITVVNAIDNY
jgi:hypothetical protein